MTFGVRPLTVLTLLGIISAFLFCAGAQAAEGKVLVQQWGKCGPNWDMYRISIVGPIDDIMLAEFAKAAEDPRVKDTQKYTGPTVRLNSLGGSVSDAMAIGNIIRNAGYFTAVYEGDECSSACVLVLAGGVSRIASWGKIGIHRPHFNEDLFAQLSQSEARKKYEEMADGVRQYLAHMGLSENLYTAMSRISSDKVNYLTATEIKAYGLEGEDAAWSEWQRAKMIQLEGRTQYDVNQSFFAILMACSNKLSNPDSCDKGIRSEFRNQLEACANHHANDYVGCAKQIERRMIVRYQ